jgi:hypothetical protein
MCFDQQAARIEADGVRIGAGREPLAHVGMRDRIDGLVDGGELIAPDLRFRPERNVVRRDRHRQQQPLHFGLKVLEGTALRAAVSPEPVVIEAPVSRVRARVLERDEHFAGEAVIADAGYGPFDAPLVAGMPHPRGVDVKMPRLRVLEKAGRDARRQRIGLEDDRLGVIRDDDIEDAPEKLPGRFTRLNRARGRFFEAGIDEAVAGARRGKNEGAKATLFPLGQREPPDAARIDLQLLAGLTIEHRDRRGGFPKLQLEDREAVERGVGDLDTVADEQLADLREPHTVTEPALDRRTLLKTARPAVTARPTARGVQREQDLPHLLVADRRPHADTGGGCRREIPPYGLRIQSELGGDAFLRKALAAEPQDLFDFDHRDLAIHPRLLVPGPSPELETDIARSGERGERF